jgi:nicotinate-nucleotide adenylyltransferase
MARLDHIWDLVTENFQIFCQRPHRTAKAFIGLDFSLVPLRIGLFGGTFDPPHVGHLVTAVNVRHALALDLVLLMVANDPWQKSGVRPITPAVDRLAMVQAAVAGIEGLEAGSEEMQRGGPSYTADTLATLRVKYAGARFFTIVGDDAAAHIDTWERVNEVVAMSSLVVIDRPGSPVTLSQDYEWRHVEVPRLEVSSTDLRCRVTDGRPLDYLVPEPVIDIIRDRGLYGLRVGSQL